MNRFNDPFKNYRDLIGVNSDLLKQHTSALDVFKDSRALIGFDGDLFRQQSAAASVLDAFKDSHALTGFDNSLFGQQRAVASALDAFKDNRALIGFDDNLFGQQNAAASALDAFKDNHALIGFGSKLFEQYRAVSSALDSFRDHHALFGSNSDFFKRNSATSFVMDDPLKEFRTSIEKLSFPFENIPASIENIKNIALEIDDDVSIEQSGRVSILSKSISAEDLQEISSQIIRQTVITPSASLEESINCLLDEIRSQKDPLTQKLLIWFIVPLILIVIGSIITPIADHYIKSYLNNDKRALSKQIKAKVVSSVPDAKVLSAFRYVSTDVLDIKASAAQKSELIGNLRFGHAVKIIERNKSWALIEWINPTTDEEITGWVFSRYLKKYK